MRSLGRWAKERRVGGATLLAKIDMDVTGDDDLPALAARQDWRVGGDERAWLEPYVIVAYAAKMVTNFRGDQSLQVWLEATGQVAGGGYQISTSLPEVGGTYTVEIFERPGGLPFIQTPVVGGSRKFRELEAGGTARGLFNVIRRNGPESKRRAEAAMKQMKILGSEFGYRPSASSARDMSSAVMHVLESERLVPQRP